MAAGAATGGETPTFKAPSAQETALPAPPGNADETYTEQTARAHHQLETSLSGDKELFGTYEGNYNYQKALLAKAEPERFAANRYRGVREGISESGINAGRIGGIASDYVLKNARNLEIFGRNVNALNARAAGQVYGYGQELTKAGKGLNQRTLDRLEKENPQTPEPPPGPNIAPGFLPQPGGTLPGGAYAPGNTTNVRVGPNTLSARRAAAAKARKR